MVQVTESRFQTGDIGMVVRHLLDHVQNTCHQFRRTLEFRYASASGNIQDRFFRLIQIFVDIRLSAGSLFHDRLRCFDQLSQHRLIMDQGNIVLCVVACYRSIRQ